MSEVKRYDMRVSLGGVESYESPCGDYVDYDDYAALQAKCAALAAENAGLKYKGREVLNEACKVYDKFNANVDSCFGDFMDGQTLHEFQFLLDVETQATDAFLAEVRAQGVERMIEVKQQQLDGMHSDTFAIGAVRDSIRRGIYELKVFAEILRKGESMLKKSEGKAGPVTCCRHHETILQVHPFEQLMSHPPQPKMYCPECEPSIAEWVARSKQEAK